MHYIESSQNFVKFYHFSMQFESAFLKRFRFIQVENT